VEQLYPISRETRRGLTTNDLSSGRSNGGGSVLRRN